MTEYADLLSNFRNPRLLKRGGQKSAFRVTAPGIGDAVAKIGHYRSDISLQRARREVDILRSIDSRYYPKQYDFQVASGSRYLVIEEYIDSTPLAACTDCFTQPPDALTLIRHLIEGLRLLWDQRVVHRDVKPDNVLIRPDRTPVIIDLGIARLLDNQSLTVSHAQRGPCTPVYAAPEQLRNRKAAIDARTDQFALGIILVQLLLGGQHPFDPQVTRDGESIVHNILDGKWHRPTAESVPASITALATVLLGPEPHDRYRSCDILVEAVDRLLAEAS